MAAQGRELASFHRLGSQMTQRRASQPPPRDFDMALPHIWKGKAPVSRLDDLHSLEGHLRISGNINLTVVPAEGAARQHQLWPAHPGSESSSPRASLPNTNGNDTPPPQGVTPRRPLPLIPTPWLFLAYPSIFKFWKHSLLSRLVYFPTQQTFQLPPAANFQVYTTNAQK